MKNPFSFKIGVKNQHAERFEAEASKAEINNFAHQFADKSFYTSARKMYFIMQAGSFLSACFSAFFAYSITVFYIQSNTGTALAVSIAAALLMLGFIELVKRFALSDVVTEYLKRKRLPVIAVIGSGLLLAVSIALSVFGAMHTVNVQGTEKQGKLSERSGALSDSVRNAYAQKIAALQSEKKKIEARNTWKGKTWLPKKERKLVQSLTDRILKLETNADKEAANLRTRFKSDSAELESDIAHKAYTFGFASLLNEMLCVLAVFFTGYYRFRVLAERGVLKVRQVNEDEQPKTPTPTATAEDSTEPKNLSEIERLFDFLTKNESPTPTPTGGINRERYGNDGRGVGFEVPKPDSSEDETPETNGNPTPWGVADCPQCAKRFTRRAHNHKYCSNDCRQTAYEKRSGNPAWFKSVPLFLPGLAELSELLSFGVPVWVLLIGLFLFTANRLRKKIRVRFVFPVKITKRKGGRK